MIIRQSFQQRLPLPGRIQNAPQLELGLELFYGAFWDISTGRPLAFAEGPVSWFMVQQYAESLGIEGEQREDLHHHIRLMDNAYLEYRAKKRPGKK